ncbi:MAG: hypothetical protein R3B84_10905 [Zavarzinella sp.]
MNENTRPMPTGAFAHFDLPTIFRAAVELAETIAGIPEGIFDVEDTAENMPQNYEELVSPKFEWIFEKEKYTRRIREETQRLKLSLGAIGPLEFRNGETDGGPQWDSYKQRFINTVHDRVVRLALYKLALAAIDLSGFGYWKGQQQMRESGFQLLKWGLAQLWKGMSKTERELVRDRLSHTEKVIGWPSDENNDPMAYNGPEEIPISHQNRIIANFYSCPPSYLDDFHNSENTRIRQELERYLRRASLDQFVEMADETFQALESIAASDFDSQKEWLDLRYKAFWNLQCLMRANDIAPVTGWPDAAIQHRTVLADSASVLFRIIGGTTEITSTIKPAEEEESMKRFKDAILHLRNAIETQFIEHLLAGPDDVRLSPKERSMLEVQLRIPRPPKHHKKLNQILNNHLEVHPQTSNSKRKLKKNGESSTESLLLAALTLHHEYSEGGCMNHEPIGCRKLAELAGVSAGSATAFFKKHFEQKPNVGYKGYKIKCLNGQIKRFFMQLEREPRFSQLNFDPEEI